MLTEPVTVERDGHVLLIGVNRPAKRNAFNLAALDALGRAYEILGINEELRTGVVFAHGDHFSAGLDLAEVGPAMAEHGPQVLCGSHRFDPFGVWGDPVPKPVVMAVNGVAFTLSIELALAADIVVAAEDVRFRLLEIGRGIVPFGGATFRAPAHRRGVRRRRGRADRAGPGSGPGRGARPPGRRTGTAHRPAGSPKGPGHIGQRRGRTRSRADRGARVPGVAASGHLG
jgi:enoyl-CoA hydratase/carnithine racemase